jgi:hypothetical protein
LRDYRLASMTMALPGPLVRTVARITGFEIMRLYHRSGLRDRKTFASTCADDRERRREWFHERCSLLGRRLHKEGCQ